MQRVELLEGLSLSRLVYGMWRVTDDTDTSATHVGRKIAACLDQGITTIDQADIYGGYTAEAVLGACLQQQRGLRQKIEIVTKCDIVAPVGRHQAARVKYYDTSRQHIQASVAASLQALGTDYLDVLLIHRPDPLMDHHETGAVLDELITQGKVRAVGVSNFKAHDWSLLQSAMQHKLVTNQIELSLSAHQGFANGDVAFHQQHGHPIMAWSPLGGGALLDSANPVHVALKQMADATQITPAALAVAWLLAHPAMILPVLGTNNLQRIAEIHLACEVDMDRQSWFELYKAALGREVA